jgi:PAS domain S-box-containing protein
VSPNEGNVAVEGGASRSGIGGARRWVKGGPGLLMVLGFAVVVLAGGAVLSLRQSAMLTTSAAQYVDAVVHFRGAQIESWLAERRGDLEVTSRDAMLAAGAAVPSAARPTAPEMKIALRRLENIAKSYQYDAAVLLDSEDRQLLSTGRPLDLRMTGLLGPVVRARTQRLAAPPQVLWTSKDPDALFLALVAPLFHETEGTSQVVGTVILCIDASGPLRSVLGIAPAASRSGELNLLLRTSTGSPLLFYSRGTEGTAIVERPLGSDSTPEALLFAGKTDLSDAVDVAGNTVVARVHQIKGMPWTVIGRIDRNELFAPSLRALWVVLGLVAILLLGLALFVYSLWRRRANQAVRDSEERFRNIFENMQDAYLLAANDGQILLVNPAAVRMLGYQSADELCGKNMARDVFRSPEDRAELKARLLAAGFVQGHKAIFKRADGSEVIVEGNVRLVRDVNGGPPAVEGVVRDMSTHYEIREQLIKAREAAVQAAMTKAQFVANMSHEIRTPLNAISGLGHLLARADLSAKAADYVGKMQISVRMLLDIVNNVLDFSKLEAGRMTLEAIPFRLADVLAGMTNILALPAEDKHIQLTCTIDPRVPPSLIGDPVRLGQILTNLAGNGIKFTASGMVVVEVSLVEPAEQTAVDPSRVRLRFDVRDTGMGIAVDQVARVFEPFVQADGSTTRRFGGTGLGLAISHQLVGAMGGTLMAKSEAGHGSTFTFTVPFQLPTPQAQSLSASAIKHTHADPIDQGQAVLLGIRVLVAEDNAINQQVARELLEAAGATVTIAPNGTDAVAKATTDPVPFDAVLMDLQMPDMDGFEATRLIRQHAERGNIPIIAMTAHAFEQERQRCVAAGMNDHVTKPVEPAKLVATVARWTKGDGSNSRTSLVETSASASSGLATRPIDFKAGLRRVGGNVALFDRLLTRFADDWADGATRMTLLVETGDFEQARRLAHTLKGTSATLGIQSVSDVASEIETVLAGKTPPAASLDKPLSVLAGRLAAATKLATAQARDGMTNPDDAAESGMAGAMEGASGDLEADSKTPFDKEVPTWATISELEGLINRRNLRARETVDRLRRLPLPAACHESFARVAGNIERLDYAEAAAALAQLKTLLGAPQEERPL